MAVSTTRVKRNGHKLRNNGELRDADGVHLTSAIGLAECQCGWASEDDCKSDAARRRAHAEHCTDVAKRWEGEPIPGLLELTTG